MHEQEVTERLARQKAAIEHPKEMQAALETLLSCMEGSSTTIDSLRQALEAAMRAGVSASHLKRGQKQLKVLISDACGAQLDAFSPIDDDLDGQLQGTERLGEAAECGTPASASRASPAKPESDNVPEPQDAEGLALQLAETAVRPVLVRAAEDEEKELGFALPQPDSRTGYGGDPGHEGVELQVWQPNPKHFLEGLVQQKARIAEKAELLRSLQTEVEEEMDKKIQESKMTLKFLKGDVEQ
ncbi:unnamed protein product [Symbiodinium natans]|uniref:Uncharacterized protein n=1 Tax=Symbiodinium natans TaxID=878477 RepID=A0A812IEQ4_9DINO|nr:unnamed protein product [Symbiodinium natans]